MRRKQRRRIPKLEDLPRILDDELIKELAQEAKLSWAANLKKFAETIREAAERFITSMAVPADVAVRNEIRALYSAAERNRHTETARRVRELSPKARTVIKQRGGRPTVNLEIPDQQAFDDPASGDEACKTIVRLLRVGMERGKLLLHAPRPQPRPPRRKAELDLITWVRVAYYEATGMMPPRTAKPGTGPFPLMLQTFLDKIAPGASAVALMNKRERDFHRELERRGKEKDSGTGSIL
jgi:hypothetical protein